MSQTRYITTLSGASINVRRDTLDEDGIERTHRYVLDPGDDLTGQPEDIAAIAAAIWTPEAIAAYRARASGLP